MIINIITLGCSKNLVDSEYLIRQLENSGHKVYHNGEDVLPDILIINTCGFILDAKEESIDMVLSGAALKASGKLKKLFVIGCLSERYSDELSNEIPEVDGFFGVWDQKQIIEAIGADYYPMLVNQRTITTPSHYAFLKISEGCNRQCAFCAIPGIRGKQQSKHPDDIIEEANNLANAGVKEIILIAQDLTSYGTDLQINNGLHDLLKLLIQVEGIEWIRLHYAYPDGFSNEVIQLMADEPKICNYLDIPIQHINSKVLSNMKRGHNREILEKLLFDLRNTIENVAIRTTLLTGFPGETEEAFEELYTFIERFRFDRLGVFPYSHEENTPAFRMNDDVPEEIKQERVNRLMELQQQISLAINQQKTGKIFRVIIDREENDHYIGRTQYDSPEVDNEVLIKKDFSLIPGRFYDIYIEKAAEFDLFGSPLSCPM